MEELRSGVTLKTHPAELDTKQLTRYGWLCWGFIGNIQVPDVHMSTLRWKSLA